MEYPEPLATIARMRNAGHRDAEIAEQLGMDRRKMQMCAQEWNRKQPDTPVPLANKGHVSQLPVDDILRAYRNGDPVKEIARRHGLNTGSVASVIQRLRKQENLPRRYTAADQLAPSAQYERLRDKGACPSLGTMSGLIDRLGVETFNRLLTRLDRKDACLVDAIARIVKEALDDPC